ncbi:MAG: RHS repeat-associated core domain-containing protein [Cyanobacteria bacterium TGS_CYA1]|nr:RHS repeat-associated core domain-containing protein [Cyanobacteria bacterium TGS_CYA1]
MTTTKKPKPDSPKVQQPGFVFTPKQTPVAPATGRSRIETRPLPDRVIDVSKLPKALQNQNEDAVQSFAPGFASGTVAGAANITELARALKSDVDLIWQFMHDQVEFLPTYGSQKGALGCLIDGMGNSFDLSDLMIQLLTTAGYTASFQSGEIELNQADVSAWLGTDPTDIFAASNKLAEGGIANTVYWTGSEYKIYLSHCWVKCTISGTAYHFDPAMKSYTDIAGINLATAMSYPGTSSFMSDATSGATVTSDYVQNINRANIRSNLDTLTSNFVSYLQANNLTSTTEDIIGGRRIVAASTTPLRQTSLPYLRPMTTPTTWASIPNAYKSTLNVTYDTIDETFYSADIHGKRLTLFFNGSHQAELRLDGSLIATSSAQTPGSWNSVWLEAVHPYPTTFADEGHWQTVFEGSYVLICQAWGNASPRMTEIHRVKQKEAEMAGGSSTSEGVLGESLSVFWHQWNATNSWMADVFNRMTTCTTVYHHQTGLVYHMGSPFMDLGGIVGSSSALDNDWNNVDTNDTSLAKGGIAFEAGAVELDTGSTGISATTMLDKAMQAGLKIYDASSSNWLGSVEPALTNYSSGDKTNIENWWINAGWRVALPEDGAQTINAFTGFGYDAISPFYGAIGLYGGSLKGSGSSNFFSVSDFNNSTVVQGTSAGYYGLWTAEEQRDYIAGSSYSNVLGAVGDISSGYQGPTSGLGSNVSADPVVLINGNFVYDHVDLTLGSMGFPYGLSFQRFYNSAGKLVDSVLGRGWTHNHKMTAKKNSDPLDAMGMYNPIRGAAGLVQMFVTVDLYRDLTKPLDKWVTVSCANRWMLDKFIDNTMTVTMADGSQTFIKQPSGTYLPPVASNNSLTDLGGGLFRLTTARGVQYNFNSSGDISTIVFPEGMTVTYTYSSGKLSTVTNGLGRTLTLNYTGNDLTSVSDGTGRSVSFTIDANRNLTTATDPASKSTTYSYVSGKPGMMESIFKPANPSNAIVTNVYDALNRVKQQTDAYSNLTEFFIAGHRTEEKDAAGNSRVISYSSIGNITKIVNQVGKTWSNTFDGIGRLTRAEAPEGNATEYSYNSKSQVTQVKAKAKSGSGLSDITNNFTYDSTWNKVATAQDGRGNTTTNTWNATTGTLTKIERPVIGGFTPTTSFTYNARGQVITTTDPTGIVSQINYNATYERVESVVADYGVGRLNLTVSFGYDSLGNVTSVTDARGNVSSALYDNLRRVTQATSPTPFSYVSKFTYNENGSRTKVERQTSDPGNPWQTSTAAYFIDDLLSSVTSPSNETSTFAYTNLRQLWKTTDPASRVVERAYDAVGRPYTVKDPALDIASTMLYTDNGRLASIKDANNNTTSFDFDGFDRPNKTTYPDASYEQNSSYDANGNVLTVRLRSGNTVTHTFDVLNRLSTKAPTSMPTVTNTYDLAGRLTKASTPTVVGDPTSGDFEYFFDTAGRFYREQYPDGKQVTHQLDANGNATKMTYPDGYYIDRVFDELNRLTDIKLNGSGTPSLHFDFDAQSRRTKLTYGNGVASCQYGFEKDNDLTSLIQVFNGSAVTFTHKFNNVGELTSSAASDSQFIWHPSGASTVSYGTANNMNQYPTVGGVSQSYNSNGCLTGDGTWTYGYDTLNHLTSATKTGVSASYLYDPAHRQGQKTVGSTKTRYIYAGFQRIAEYDGTSGSLLNRFVYGSGLDEPLIQITAGGTVSYFHQDRIGSVIATSDNTGAVTNRYKYSSFGESAALSGTTFGFQGQRYDAESGLYYMKMRYFDPKTGRFLQPDPIGYGDGFNLYRFVGNNPNNFTDSMGLAADGSNLGSDTGPLGSGFSSGVEGEVQGGRGGGSAGGGGGSSGTSSGQRFKGIWSNDTPMTAAEFFKVWNSNPNNKSILAAIESFKSQVYANPFNRFVEFAAEIVGDWNWSFKGPFGEIYHSNDEHFWIENFTMGNPVTSADEKYNNLAGHVFIPMEAGHLYIHTHTNGGVASPANKDVTLAIVNDITASFVYSVDTQELFYIYRLGPFSALVANFDAGTLQKFTIPVSERWRWYPEQYKHP